MIVADNITVTFRKGFFLKKFKALDRLSLTVNEGDFYALLGPNGAGKSTAMYCMLGLIRPSGGSISISGKKPLLGSGMYKEIAYLPEEPHYHLYLTVEEAVSYYASLYSGRMPRQKVTDMLERLGLAEFRGLSLGKCSKGMKQKVGIAQCLLGSPRILFMDEPTRGLDPLIVREFRNILTELNRGGTTIIMNSHVLSETEMVADRVAIIDKGRLVAEDILENLLTQDAETYRVRFSRNEMIPDYLSEVESIGDRLAGVIPAERFGDFMAFVRYAGVKVYECSLRRDTLEDSFFKALKKGGDDA